MKNMKKMAIACITMSLTNVLTTDCMLHRVLQRKYQYPAFQARFRTRRSTQAELLRITQENNVLLQKILKQQNAQQKLVKSKDCPTKELHNHDFRDPHHGSYYSGNEPELDYGGYQFKNR